MKTYALDYAPSYFETYAAWLATSRPPILRGSVKVNFLDTLPAELINMIMGYAYPPGRLLMNMPGMNKHVFNSLLVSKLWFMHAAPGWVRHQNVNICPARGSIRPRGTKATPLVSATLLYTYARSIIANPYVVSLAVFKRFRARRDLTIIIGVRDLAENESFCPSHMRMDPDDMVKTAAFHRLRPFFGPGSTVECLPNQALCTDYWSGGWTVVEKSEIWRDNVARFERALRDSYQAAKAHKSGHLNVTEQKEDGEQADKEKSTRQMEVKEEQPPKKENPKEDVPGMYPSSCFPLYPGSAVCRECSAIHHTCETYRS